MNFTLHVVVYHFLNERDSLHRKRSTLRKIKGQQDQSRIPMPTSLISWNTNFTLSSFWIHTFGLLFSFKKQRQETPFWIHFVDGVCCIIDIQQKNPSLRVNQRSVVVLEDLQSTHLKDSGSSACQVKQHILWKIPLDHKKQVTGRDHHISHKDKKLATFQWPVGIPISGYNAPGGTG